MMAVTVKLTKTQQELLDAMKAGIVVRYAPSLGRFNPTSYYYRDDNFKKVTAAANALISKQVAQKSGLHHRATLVLVQP
jgi:hypothetical protein